MLFRSDEVCHGSNALISSLREKAVSGGDSGNVAAVTAVIIGIRFSVQGVKPSDNPLAVIRMRGESGIDNGNAGVLSEETVLVGRVSMNYLIDTFHKTPVPKDKQRTSFNSLPLQ